MARPSIKKKEVEPEALKTLPVNILRVSIPPALQVEMDAAIRRWWSAGESVHVEGVTPHMNEAKNDITGYTVWIKAHFGVNLLGEYSIESSDLYALLRNKTRDSGYREGRPDIKITKIYNPPRAQQTVDPLKIECECLIKWDHKEEPVWVPIVMIAQFLVPPKDKDDRIA